MKNQIGPCRLELVTGDITEQDTDVIVNAANSRLAGGGGVDGAIHRAGGPTIMRETREKYSQGCPTGEAVISSAGNLSARYVIHAVGPVWSGGRGGEEDKLASAYRNSLDLAVRHQCHSISFPSLSTGAYRYPLESAARTALHTMIAFLERERKPELVRLVLFDSQTYDAHAATLTAILAE